MKMRELLLGSLKFSVLEGEEATRKNENAIIVAKAPGIKGLSRFKSNRNEWRGEKCCWAPWNLVSEL